MKLYLFAIILLIGFSVLAQENPKSATRQSRDVSFRNKSSVKKVINSSTVSSIDTIPNTVRTKQFYPNFFTKPKVELDSSFQKKDSVRVNYIKFKSKSQALVKRVPSGVRPELTKSNHE